MFHKHVGKEEIVEYVARTYREGGGVPSIRQILKQFSVCRARLYKLFPDGLKQICREAGVPYPEERDKVVKMMKGSKPAMERSRQGENFDFWFKKTELEAKVKELLYAFQLKTEGVKSEPYWRSRREQFNELAEWLLKGLKEAGTQRELELLKKDFEKLKMHYVRVIGDLTLSDRLKEQREALAKLVREYSEIEGALKPLREKFGVPIEKVAPAISELISIHESCGASTEDVIALCQFVKVMANMGWDPNTLHHYILGHHQTLLNVNALKVEKARLEKEVQRLSSERRRLLANISDLKQERDHIAEEVQEIKDLRSKLSQLLSKEMEIIGRAEMNNLVAGIMYKEGVDGLANAIVNDRRFILMLQLSRENELLAKLIDIIVQIIDDNTKQQKEWATKLSFICELFQRQFQKSYNLASPT